MYAEFQGSGYVDARYYWTVREMARQTYYFSGGENDVWRNKPFSTAVLKKYHAQNGYDKSLHEMRFSEIKSIEDKSAFLTTIECIQTLPVEQGFHEKNDTMCKDFVSAAESDMSESEESDSILFADFPQDNAERLLNYLNELQSETERSTSLPFTVTQADRMASITYGMFWGFVLSLFVVCVLAAATALVCFAWPALLAGTSTLALVAGGGIFAGALIVFSTLVGAIMHGSPARIAVNERETTSDRNISVQNTPSSTASIFSMFSGCCGLSRHVEVKQDNRREELIGHHDPIFSSGCHAHTQETTHEHKTVTWSSK